MTGSALGRTYFALQAAAGALWWVGVFIWDPVRELTLGGLPPVWVAALDIPLFVLASALAALGLRAAAWVAACWTVLVAVGMVGYATATGQAGWGALLMVAAAACGGAALCLVTLGRLPTELLLIGPFRFREAAAGGGRAAHVGGTALQLLFFWGLFLAVIPLAIAWFEARWGVGIRDLGGVVDGALGGGLGGALDTLLAWARWLGIALFAAASALGLWSALAMSVRGEGTPLPSATAQKLVLTGPYRFVRNPMAVAGIAQGVAVGLMLGSWLVVAYALCGSLVWNWGVRPHEEADLEARFGAPFADYAARVPCWLPAPGRARRLLAISGLPRAAKPRNR